MNAVKELKRCLRAYEADLKRKSVFLRDSDADLSFGMVMLLSDRGSSAEPGFLTELRRVLIEHADGFEQGDGGEKRRSEIANWLGEEHKGLHTPANWLKLAIEQYPIRLFVVIDREDPRWKSNEHTPLDGDDFWNAKDGFFRKRICWLSAEELMKDMPEGNGHRPDEAGATVSRFLSRLRLRWIRHLAHNVGGLQELNTLRLAICLVDEGARGEEAVKGGSSETRDARLRMPDTLPSLWRDQEGRGASSSRGRVCLDLTELTASKLEDWPSILGLSPEDATGPTAALLYRRHCIAAELYREWVPIADFFEVPPFASGGKEHSEITERFFSNLLFQGAISGGGRLFSLLDAALLTLDEAKPGVLEEVPPLLLDLAEAALLRIGVADERFQQWFHDLSGDKGDEHRGWVIAQRVVPVFLNSPSAFGQPNCVNQPHAVLGNVEGGATQLIWKFPDGSGLDILWPAAQRRAIDILIVHQGLLDKLLRETKSPEILAQWVLGLRKDFPFVAITSGRGRPENIPTGCKFMPYASLDGAIHGVYFEKAVLWRALQTL